MKFRKIGLVILGGILGVCLSEIGLRGLHYLPYRTTPVNIVFEPSGVAETDQLLGYSATPGKFECTLKGKLISNATHWSDKSRATRDHEVDTDFTGRPKIHLYGCSFTYGQYLDDTMGVGWKLQERLKEYDVRNYAFAGYGIVQSYLRLQQHILKGHIPKWVILGYASFQDERNIMSRRRRKKMAVFWSQNKILDAICWPTVVFSIDTVFRIQYASVDYDEWPLMRHSALLNLVESVHNDIVRDQDAENLSSQVMVDSIHSWSKKFKFELLILGMKNDNGTTLFLERCAKNGIETLDVSVDLTLPEYSLYPLDGHPSSRANSLFAKEIATYVNLPDN